MWPSKGDRQAHKELAVKVEWRNFTDNAAESHCSMPKEGFEAGLWLSDPEMKIGRLSGGGAGKLKGGVGWEVKFGK